MARRLAAGRARRTAIWTLFLLVAGLLLSTAGAVVAAPVAAPAAAHGSAGATHAAIPAHSARSSSAIHPALTTNGTVGQTYNSTKLPAAAHSNQPCYYDNYSFANYAYCFQQTQSPSIVSLANGDLGVGYSMETTVGLGCNATGGANLTSWTSTNVAWTLSSTNGTSWGAPQILGNSTCQWPSAAMPTFATGTSGNVYGSFILSNASVNATTPYGTQPLFPSDWTNTTGDALGFVTSSNNGSTWSSVSEVPGVTGAARPAMAVYGNTIYIAYIFDPNVVANWSIGQFTYPGLTVAPSVDIVTSTNGGSTWSSPVTLPGLNSSAGNWSSNPSIAVTSTGTVYVAYDTNRTCELYCYYPGDSYFAEDIVLSTSVNNGTTWSSPVTVGGKSGENPNFQNFYDYYGYGFEGGWQLGPQTSVAVGATAATIYVGYSGTYSKSLTYPYYNWGYNGVFAAVSTNSGASWTNTAIQAPLDTSNYDDVYSPGVAYSAGTVYLAFVWQNNSYCSSFPCSPFIGSYSAWLATSTNGSAWTSTFTGISKMPNAYTGATYQGWTSGVAFTAAGSPVTATTLPGYSSFAFIGYNGSAPIYGYNYTSNVTIGFVYNGPTTYATFVEQNLTPGTTWGVAVDGYVSMGNGNGINVSGIPLNVGVQIAILPQAAGYGVIESSTVSVPGYYEFTGPIIVYVNYSIEYAVNFAIQPTNVPDADINFCYLTQCYDIFTNNGFSSSFPSLPWYFPLNATIQVTSFGEPPITYWNGTGAGSYTGAGSELNLTITGPINETAWAGSYGVYTEGFYANGLPTTSSYSFGFDGTTYTTPATNWTYVPDVGTGGYAVTNITANSSTAGWQYFGFVPGGSNVLVVPAQPTVGFDFAYVNTASPVGVVTFHAKGIGTGTVWSVSFNGTYYSSSTPWLNVSTHPGTFPWAVGAAVAANASVGYAPVGSGSSVTVLTGTTVNISYTSAYRVDVIAGIGGTVSGAGNHWLATGTGTSYTAAPSNGYEFGSWTGVGAGSYTGSNLTAPVTANGAITETASFYPLPNARFNVTFQETGIVSGAWWTVTLNGVGYSSNSSALTVSNLLSCSAGTLGQYKESVGVAYDNATGTTRYVAVNPPAQFCTNGGLVQALTFAPQYLVTVSATSGGTAYLADGTTQSNTSLWASPTDTVQLTAIHSVGYQFGGWNGTGTGAYTGNSVSPPISVASPVTEFATFSPVRHPGPPHFNETFAASVPFPSGTAWSVKINGTSYAGVGSSIVVHGLIAGTYTATVSGATASNGLTKWSPVTPAVPVTVSGDGSTPVAFGKPSYWVTVGGSSGGTESPSSGWEVAGSTLSLNATPNLGETFVNWTGTGGGNYTGNASATTVTVEAPITEFATFAPVIPAATQVTSVWSSGTTWAILGLVGLLVGLIVGIAVRRMRSAPDGPSGGAQPWSGPSSEDTSGGTDGSSGPAEGGSP